MPRLHGKPPARGRDPVDQPGEARTGTGLRAAAPDLRLVFLRGDRELVAARQAARAGHFMPASLVASQFATLEAPDAEEDAIVLDVAATPQALAEAALDQLR